MTQPSLWDAEPVRPRKRGRVTRSSVLAYQERDRRGRVAYVLSWLDARAFAGEQPTSAELAAWAYPHDGLEGLLTARRALSDALALGLVSHAGERTCSVSGRKCVTWAVRSR
jgi:hypothetical protein